MQAKEEESLFQEKEAKKLTTLLSGAEPRNRKKVSMQKKHVNRSRSDILDRDVEVRICASLYINIENKMNNIF